MSLAAIYPIVDFAFFAGEPDPVAAAISFADELLDAGATLIQLRDKSDGSSQHGGQQRFLSCARELRRVTLNRATLIINDRLDLCLASGADGVHLGQTDLSPASARRIFDQANSGKKLLIGYSTHSLDQVRQADTLPVDYIAIGPVFSTASKVKADPVVGLEGVRQARRVTVKPLVAIGGITRRNCAQVKDSGADSVALISDLFESPGKAVADFLRILG
jgi:thiamine-phosphate pyrophosphorylase